MDIRSNKPFAFKSSLGVQPCGLLQGKGVYVTVYPSSCPNTDTINIVVIDYMSKKISSLKQACFAGCAQTLLGATPPKGVIYPFSIMAVI